MIEDFEVAHGQADFGEDGCAIPTTAVVTPGTGRDPRHLPELNGGEGLDENAPTLIVRRP